MKKRKSKITKTAWQNACLKKENKRLCKALEECRSTIQIIYSWASFVPYDGQQGDELNPGHVIDLCNRTLDKIS